MKKLSMALLAALLISPSLVKADPVNTNSGVTNTPAANGGTNNKNVQKSKMKKSTKKHNHHHKRKTSKKTEAPK